VTLASVDESYRIMVVDDEPEIAEAVAYMLSAITDHHVEPFIDPCLALVAFQDNPYHLVLTDLRMPKIEGLELIRQIKEMHPDTEVLIMTAVKDQGTIHTSIELGASDIFYKPVDLIGMEKAVCKSHGKFLQKSKFRNPLSN
jgi:DNA-binding NtrC family response regulator